MKVNKVGSIDNEGKKVIVLVETGDQEIASIIFELLEAGRKIHNVLVHEIGDISEEIAHREIVKASVRD